MHEAETRPGWGHTSGMEIVWFMLKAHRQWAFGFGHADGITADGRNQEKCATRALWIAGPTWSHLRQKWGQKNAFKINAVPTGPTWSHLFLSDA